MLLVISHRYSQAQIIYSKLQAMGFLSLSFLLLLGSFLLVLALVISVE